MSVAERDLAPASQQTTREAILEAALDIFADQGFRGGSVRDICARAGVNAALVNYHFGSKQRLWEAVCAHCSEQTLKLAHDALRFPLVPEQVVDDVLGALFDAFTLDARPARIMAWAMLQAQAMDFASTARTFQPILDVVSQYVDQLAQQGYFVGRDIPMVLGHVEALLVYQFISQAAHRWSFGKDFSDAEHAARARQQLLDSARAILGGRDDRSSPA